MYSDRRENEIPKYYHCEHENQTEFLKQSQFKEPYPEIVIGRNAPYILTKTTNSQLELVMVAVMFYFPQIKIRLSAIVFGFFFSNQIWVPNSLGGGFVR